MSARNHEAWKEQLPAYLLGALSPGEKADLEHHLGGCAECQAELRWLEPAQESLVEEVRQVEPSPELRSRLMAAVEEDLRENPVEDASTDPASIDAPVPAPADAPTESRNEHPRFEWLNFGQLLRPATLGALAVVLFVGVIAGYAVNGGDDGSSPSNPEPQVIAANPEPGEAQAIMVATGNSGTLKITDLKALKEGEVYQAWIQKGQSVEPTDSLFTPRGDGTATTSIPDLTGVDVIMVSAEPEGGSEQPTSDPIITIEMPS